MGVAHIGQIAMGLMTEKLPGSTPVLAVAKATTKDEKRLVSRLDCIAQDVRDKGFEAPVLFIVGKVVALYEQAPVADMAPEITQAIAHA